MQDGGCGEYLFQMSRRRPTRKLLRSGRFWRREFQTVTVPFFLCVRGAIDLSVPAVRAAIVGRGKKADMRLGRTTTLIVALMSLWGCGNDELPVAEKAVREQLKDPDSARFSREFMTPDGSLVCGLVNAKNSVGRYLGFRRFYSIPRLRYAMVEPKNEGLRPAFESAWKEERCRLAS